MNILIIGGTRYFGIPMTIDLINKGHDITIATRGNNKDNFGKNVSRIIFDRCDESSIIKTLKGQHYDIIIDKIAYSSNDVKRILDNVLCEKYILMSTSAVYTNIHKKTAESDFSADKYPFRWCEREENYAEIKRQAECAVTQKYPEQKYIAVRYPVVIGENDYTKRLLFYVECVINGTPMYIDDLDSRISFIYENDAGLFLSHIADKDTAGALNACSDGDISILEIIDHIEKITGKKAILSADGKPAPYNGYPAYATLDTSKAKQLQFSFSDIKEKIYCTIDNYVYTILNKRK